MKSTPLPRVPVAEPDWQEEADRADLIDVSAQDGTGDLERRGRLAFAFRLAGFDVKKVEKAPYHPVWIVHLANHAPHFYEHKQFIQHVRQILWTAGVSICNKDLMIDQTRSRILISFVLLPLVPARTKKSELRRLLIELP